MALVKEQMAPEAEDAKEPGEPPEGTPTDQREDVAEGETEGGDPEGADKFMVFVERLLADEKSGLMESIAQRLKDSGEPADALAKTAYELVAMADEKTGGIVDDEDLAGVAAEVLGHVADIAESIGIKVNGKMIAGATNLMIRKFMEDNGDVEGLQQMQQVDIDGTGQQLDQMMMGAGEPAPEGVPA